jgi:hypothetical protein
MFNGRKTESIASGYLCYQRGNRLQITADVDLDGIATLKDILDDYARVLARLAGKRPGEG